MFVGLFRARQLFRDCGQSFNWTANAHVACCGLAHPPVLWLRLLTARGQLLFATGGASASLCLQAEQLACSTPSNATLPTSQTLSNAGFAPALPPLLLQMSVVIAGCCTR